MEVNEEGGGPVSQNLIFEADEAFHANAVRITLFDGQYSVIFSQSDGL